MQTQSQIYLMIILQENCNSTGPYKSTSGKYKSTSNCNGNKGTPLNFYCSHVHQNLCTHLPYNLVEPYSFGSENRTRIWSNLKSFTSISIDQFT